MTASLTIGKVRFDQRVFMAPMTGLTDLPFRKIARQLGIVYCPTEMVATALLDTGRKDIERKLALDEDAPIKIVQLVGADPDSLAKAARAAQALGADIIDFNLGCPAREVAGHSCGSALMRFPDKAARLMGAIRESVDCAVTVKMRLGWDERCHNAVFISEKAESLGYDAITVHGRTRQQYYKGQADWIAISQVTDAIKIPVIVNGDIVDMQSLQTALSQSKASAAMIGRGAIGQPWIIALNAKGEGDTQVLNLNYKIDIIKYHIELSMLFYGSDLGLKVFRKHLAAYIDHLDLAMDSFEKRQVRADICRLNTHEEVFTALDKMRL